MGVPKKCPPIQINHLLLNALCCGLWECKSKTAKEKCRLANPLLTRIKSALDGSIDKTEAIIYRNKFHVNKSVTEVQKQKYLFVKLFCLT